MAKITFLGGEETGNVGFVDWNGVRFELNKPVEVTDPYMIHKALGNRFFKVTGNGTAGEPKAAIKVEEVDEADEADEEVEEQPVKRGPGRPRKVKDEDDD